MPFLFSTAACIPWRPRAVLPNGTGKVLQDQSKVCMSPPFVSAVL